MHRPILIAASLGACLLLGGYSAGVRTHGAAGAAAPSLAQGLADETHHRLALEFEQQDVGFELNGTRVWPLDDGLLRVRGEGTADFGAEGRAATTIEAVYDPGDGRWLRLDYQLL